LCKSQNNCEEGLLRLLRDLVRVHVAILVLADRNKPWFLITDLSGKAAALTALYARRMAVG